MKTHLTHSNNQAVTRGLLFFLLAFLLILLTTNKTFADEYRPAYLSIKQTSKETFNVVWKLPSAAQNQALNLTVGLPTGSRLTKPKLKRRVGAGSLEQFSFFQQGGLTDQTITIHGLANAPTEVLARIQWQDGITETARMDASNTSFIVQGVPTFWGVINTYLTFGFEHILAGLDHLLFVGCLIFIAKTWRRILITITGFTLAHSITLTLAALGLVRLPIAPIESVIALSIVFLAREIMMQNKQTLTWRYPIAVSSSFGLLHGFGFASALSEVGLPQTEIPAALLAFNIGVELGQITFVAVLLALAKILQAGINQVQHQQVIQLRKVEQAGALAIGVISSYWLLERIAGI